MARGTRRDQKREEFWRRRLRAQAGSGLSVRAWCRRRGLRESAFYWWRAQVARRDAATASPFAPVQVVADTLNQDVIHRALMPGAAGRIEIVLPGERRVHVLGRVERQMLVEVLAALANAPRAEPAMNDQARSGREAPGC